MRRFVAPCRATFGMIPSFLDKSSEDCAKPRGQLRHQIFKRDTLVPESETSPIRPAFVSTNTSTGAVAVVVSITPFAPTFTSATDPSPPTDQPSELRKLLSASRVMNRKMMAFDWAPAWKPNDPDTVL